MVHVVRSAEELLQERLSRRGFSSEDCRQLLKSGNGNVILLSRYSRRKNDVKDFVGVKSC